MSDPTAPASYAWGNWPPSPIERQIRHELDVAQAKVAAVEQLVLKHKIRDGRLPICQILAAWLDIEETS